MREQLTATAAAESVAGSTSKPARAPRGTPAASAIRLYEADLDLSPAPPDLDRLHPDSAIHEANHEANHEDQ